jgi:ribonuclease D
LTTGSKLAKGESYTDWCKRPLTDAQLSYAADDVRFLFAAADSLKQTLEQLGRALWVEQEKTSLETADAYRSDPGDAWRKVGGRGSLSPVQMAVLQEVAAWRENEAQTRDLPRGWIMKDPTLIEVARRAPQSVTDLGRIRGLNEREVQRSSSGLLEAVRKGKEAPAVQPGRGPGRAVQARARMIGGLADALVRARCEEASIAVESVATRADVEALLVDVLSGDLDESRHRLLEGWRRDLVGDAIVALARGRIALKTIDRPPYIEETAI